MADFFISFNRADSAWAEWITWQLENAGFTVTFQLWDFQPGRNFIAEMDKATKGSERTIAILSSNYLRSGFGSAEWMAAFRQDPIGEKGKLIPIRVEKFELDGLLAGVIYIDLVGLDEPIAIERLQAGVAQRRAKPAQPPRYPGASAKDKPGYPSLSHIVNSRDNRITQLTDSIEKAAAIEPGLSDPLKESSTKLSHTKFDGATGWRNGRKVLGLAGTAWTFVWSKTVPPLIAVGGQWVLAVLILFWLSPEFGIIFGVSSLLWLLPLGYLIARFITCDMKLARFVGGFAGGIVGAAISQSITDWATKYGLAFGMLFGGLLAGYWLAPEKPMKVILTVLNTLLLAIFLDVFKYAKDFFSFSNISYIGGIMALLMVVACGLAINRLRLRPVEDAPSEDIKK